MNERYNNLKADVEDGYRACEEISSNEERLLDRVHVLEEVTTLKAENEQKKEELTEMKFENNELRVVVNSIILELNNVITALNARYTVNQ